MMFNDYTEVVDEEGYGRCFKNGIAIYSAKAIANIGEMIHRNNRMWKVIGYAIGDDGSDCYVCSKDRDSLGWQTYLVPVKEVDSVWYKREL